jgi:hypothetical protein
MSAYIVDPADLQKIFHYLDGVECELAKAEGSREKTIEMLAKENIKSIACRYPDTKGKETESFTDMALDEYVAEAQFPIDPDSPIPSPGEVLSLVRRYEYQSCEHKGWEDSKARKFMDGVKEICHQHFAAERISRG